MGKHFLTITSYWLAIIQQHHKKKKTTKKKKKKKQKKKQQKNSVNPYLFMTNIQSNFNGSNTFGTMEIRSRHG